MKSPKHIKLDFIVHLRKVPLNSNQLGLDYWDIEFPRYWEENPSANSVLA